jgi:hypothetical protein
MLRWIVALGCIVYIGAPSFSQNVTPLPDFMDPVRGRAVVCRLDNSQSWTNTRVSLLAGDTIVIIVQGMAAPNGLTVPSTVFWIGPEGFGGANHLENPVPTASDYSVVGKIGSGGIPFYVGGTARLICNVSGDLYLGTNDQISFDNDGYYIAHILSDNRRIFTGVAPCGAEGLPEQIALNQNYPNPFNPVTRIGYVLPHEIQVELSVYNALGQCVAILVDGTMSAGYHEVEFHASTLSTGMYFYQLRAGSNVLTRKLLVLR